MTDKHKMTILNVDDDDISRYTTSRILRGAGFEVLEAANGAEALRLVKEKPDLVILDVNLPDIQGFEVCRRIKADPATSLIPVLNVSAIYLDDQAKVLGLESGADGYLTQPMEPWVLISYVKALLRVRQAEAEAVAVGRQWQTTFDAISDAVSLLDRDSHILRCNEAMSKLVGKPFSEIVGRSCWELVHGTSEPIEGCPIVRMRETRRRETLVLPVSDQWLEVVVDPLLDEAGNLMGGIHIMTDITERKRAEEALRRSLEETARGQRTLLALSQAAQAVQRTRTPEEVYRTVGDEVRKLGYHAVVFTLTHDREHLSIAYMTFQPPLLRALEKLTGLSAQTFRVPLSQTIVFRRVLAEGETSFDEPVADFMARGLPGPVRPLAGRIAALLELEQCITAPLAVGDETIGLLHVTGRGLTEADVPAVTAFANQTAIAIENARLFEQVQAGRERLAWLTQQVVSAQEEERYRLSRELHDEASQALTALRISLDLIAEDLPAEAVSLRQRLGEAGALTEDTMEQIRLLAHDLRPPALDTVGLNYTLEDLCRDFAERTQLSVDYIGADLPTLPEAVSMCLYRFLQEALTNVAKHADASQVWVGLRGRAEMVSLWVEDNGQGFDEEARLSAGLGLLGMQERIELLGGQLKIESQPGQGTRLTAHIPLEKAHLERRRAPGLRGLTGGFAGANHPQQ
jgi:PAS domain S-box-containing protein